MKSPVMAALAVREQSRRRLTLLAIASLLVLSTSPVFGHHIALNGDQLLAGLDHIGTLCVTALHHLLAPVHYGFHVVIVIGVVYAVWDRVRAWRRVRAALRPLAARLPAAADTLWRAAVEAGLDPQSVRVVDGLPNPAFTVGLFSPRIYVAEELAERLEPDELVAVLAHEGAHARRRDPLRLSSLRALACTLFWIPALRRLSDDMADDAEVLADDVAAKGRALALASAILRLAQWPTTMRYPATAIAFQQPDLLERRIRRLVGEETHPRSHVTRRSLVGAAAALALVWSSGILMAHPLPVTSTLAHERHCDHRHEPALAHLFCLGSPFATPPTHCPHPHGA
jgi:Zn-dependent protease with chaperone function